MLQGKRNVLLLLHLASCLVLVLAQNIDTTQPIIRSVPNDQDENAYFGYSMVLHKLSATSGSMAEALRNTRCVAACNYHMRHAHMCTLLSTMRMHAYIPVSAICMHCCTVYFVLCRWTIIHHHHSSISFIIKVISHSPLHTQNNCWCPKWNCSRLSSGQHWSHLFVSSQPWTVQWIDGKWNRFR